MGTSGEPERDEQRTGRNVEERNESRERARTLERAREPERGKYSLYIDLKILI